MDMVYFNQEREVNEMKKLNHNLKVGDRFNLKPWGWQCAKVPRGEYEITGIEIGWDGISDYHIKQVNGDYTCLIERGNAEYFAGQEIVPEYGVVYDFENYQPTEDEISGADFVTEEKDEEFGFWYLGSLCKKPAIHSTMISCNFAWVKMPW